MLDGSGGESLPAAGRTDQHRVPDSPFHQGHQARGAARLVARGAVLRSSGEFERRDNGQFRDGKFLSERVLFDNRRVGKVISREPTLEDAYVRLVGGEV